MSVNKFIVVVAGLMLIQGCGGQGSRTNSGVGASQADASALAATCEALAKEYARALPEAKHCTPGDPTTCASVNLPGLAYQVPAGQVAAPNPEWVAGLDFCPGGPGVNPGRIAALQEVLVRYRAAGCDTTSFSPGCPAARDVVLPAPECTAPEGATAICN
jgi:hypothetical protein